MSRQQLSEVLARKSNHLVCKSGSSEPHCSLLPLTAYHRPLLLIVFDIDVFGVDHVIIRGRSPSAVAFCTGTSR